jgi:hypothetical protein
VSRKVLVSKRASSVFPALRRLRVTWINRFGQHRERLPSQPDVEIKSPADLPTLMGI